MVSGTLSTLGQTIAQAGRIVPRFFSGPALDADFYVFSGHKVFGPTGIGALYGKVDLLEAKPRWQGGGQMIRDVTFEKTIYQYAPENSRPVLRTSPEWSGWVRPLIISFAAVFRP